MFGRLAYLVFAVFGVGLILASGGRAADPSLVGWWTLDESSGTIAHDASGKGNDGTLHGGPTWVAGRIDGALLFDGQDDYVEVGGVGISGIGRRTVTGWARAGTVARLARRRIPHEVMLFMSGRSPTGPARQFFLRTTAG